MSQVWNNINLLPIVNKRIPNDIFHPHLHFHYSMFSVCPFEWFLFAGIWFSSHKNDLNILSIVIVHLHINKNCWHLASRNKLFGQHGVYHRVYTFAIKIYIRLGLIKIKYKNKINSVNNFHQQSHYEYICAISYVSMQ